jgi:uncharacterized metal-binding protein YceD (DUF177 family)
VSEPFSRVVRVDSIPRDGQTIVIEASPAEREALATVFKLPSIEGLTAEFILQRSGDGQVRVTGNVQGQLTQTCVVSLEPFPAVVSEEVDVRFTRPANDVAARRPSKEPQTFTIDDEDEPDPIVDGKIDLGALAAEFVALGLDPYPRKPDASFESPQEREDTPSPFAALGNRAGKTPD